MNVYLRICVAYIDLETTEPMSNIGTTFCRTHSLRLGECSLLRFSTHHIGCYNSMAHS